MIFTCSEAWHVYADEHLPTEQYPRDPWREEPNVSKIHKPAPCWVVRDHDDRPWDEDYDVHYDTKADADATVSDVRDTYDDDNTPEAIEAAIQGRDPETTARLRVGYQRAAARLASLHAVQLPEPCFTIECDGCGVEPESDEYAHVHFGPEYPFESADWDFAEALGMHFCDDCKDRAVCRECDGLFGDGSQDRDGMCVGCWEADQRKPGVGQQTIPAVTA